MDAEKCSEARIQAAICDYLALRKVFFSRTNNVPVYDKARGAFRALPKYTKRGMADIWAVKDGKVYLIEVKREEGRLSPDQVEFGKEAILAGAEYIVARSIDDVQRRGL